MYLNYKHGKKHTVPGDSNILHQDVHGPEDFVPKLGGSQIRDVSCRLHAKMVFAYPLAHDQRPAPPSAPMAYKSFDGTHAAASTTAAVNDVVDNVQIYAILAGALILALAEVCRQHSLAQKTTANASAKTQQPALKHSHL